MPTHCLTAIPIPMGLERDTSKTIRGSVRDNVCGGGHESAILISDARRTAIGLSVGGMITKDAHGEARTSHTRAWGMNLPMPDLTLQRAALIIRTSHTSLNALPLLALLPSTLLVLPDSKAF